MRIEKYNAARLGEFLESSQYETMPFVPVSKHRARSWLNNPALEPEDILLYLGFEGEEMLAYRALLPARFDEIRYAWLSGNWVRPDMRRRGLASRLFEEAYGDWGHQLMFTNYAPESKAVYDKSGRFECYAERPGRRYYFRSSTASLLGNRRTVYRRSRLLFSLADLLLNAVQDTRLLIGREKTELPVFEEISKPDLEALGFLESRGDQGFSQRGLEEFDWIVSWPWVITDPAKDQRYFFSSVSPRFRNLCIKTRSADGEMDGFLWLVLHGEKISLPYVSFKPEASPGISDLLNHYLRKCRASYLTTYHSPFIESFRPGPLLGSRRMVQKYFVTRELKRQLPDPENIRFQDGDGDVVFV